MKQTSLTSGLVFSALLIGAPLSSTFAADMAVKAPPAPMPVATFTGPEIGISLVETTHARQCITSNDPGANGLCDTIDPTGVGFTVGYGFRPWANNWIVTPFAEIDDPNVRVNHVFPGGSYLGTRSTYDVLGGVKVGPTLMPNLWAYGIGAAGWRGENMTINFIPLNSSSTTTVFGGVAGVGIAWEPFNAPVSVSLEFRHEWWDTATYSNPPASLGFNYGFRQQDNVFSLGVNWYFAGR